MRRALPAVFLLAAACSSNTDRADSGPEPRPDAAAIDAGFEDAAAADALAEDALPEDAAALDAGTGDAGRRLGPPDAAEPPFTPGMPIVSPPKEWTWIDFPVSRCMNGTPTGIGINTSTTSRKVAIFLNGGNACFNTASCLVTANTDGYGAAKFMRERAALNGGAFDRTAPENYLKDWSFVYIPYCTGDVHAGRNPNGMLRGVHYDFHGFDNVRIFLERIVPTFANATDVLLTGVSAGGFGAFYNYDQVARAFGPNVRVTGLDDSGPPMAKRFVAGCLQQHFRDTWGLDYTLPRDCAGCFDDPDGAFMEGYAQYLVRKYANRNLGLISSSADQTIRGFWGFGLFDCRDLINGFLPPDYPPQMFTDGLADLRDRVFMGLPNAKLYMPISMQHVWLTAPPWEVMHHGVVLQDWMRQAIEGDAAWSNVPPR